jgi:DNA mismatch repair protein MutL
MVGKFPYCVLNITVPFETVDVNVHPAKTEVRFTDEKRVFSVIYYAVKNALMQGDSRPEITVNNRAQRFERMSVEQFRQTAINEPAAKNPPKSAPVEPPTPAPTPVQKAPTPEVLPVRTFKTEITPPPEKPMAFSDSGVDFFKSVINKPAEKPAPVAEKAPQPTVTPAAPAEEKPITEDVKYIGEVFGTYIVAQMGDALYLIDKHAAHERIIFEKLKSTVKPETQTLLASVAVSLSGDEYTAVIENLELLEKQGFEVEDFGGSNVLVTAVPSVLADCDIKSVIAEIAQNLADTGSVEVERLDDIYHIVACRSAVKAGNLSTAYDLSSLAKQILSSKDIMYCPHGRPVAMKLTKREIEKQFGRIQ